MPPNSIVILGRTPLRHIAERLRIETVQALPGAGSALDGLRRITETSLEAAIVPTPSARGRTMLHLSLPVSGSMLEPVSLRMVKAAANADERRWLVVDARYLPLDTCHELTDIVRENKNVICLRAAATFGLSAPAMSWAICHPETARQLAGSSVRTNAINETKRLLSNPEMLVMLRRQQSEAVSTLAYGLEAFGFRVRTGAVPWVLVELGIHTREIAEDLARTRGYVFETAGQDYEWLRIPGTNRHEACRILRAVLESIVRGSGG